MTSCESSLEGKLFVAFVALIYLSYIQKRMEEKGLFSTYTMHELLDELDVIECLMEPGKAPIQGAVLNRFTGTCTLPRYWLQVRVLMHSYVIRVFRLKYLLFLIN